MVNLVRFGYLWAPFGLLTQGSAGGLCFCVFDIFLFLHPGRVQGLRFRFRVQGLGFRVLPEP